MMMRIGASCCLDFFLSRARLLSDYYFRFRQLQLSWFSSSNGKWWWVRRSSFPAFSFVGAWLLLQLAGMLYVICLLKKKSSVERMCYSTVRNYCVHCIARIFCASVSIVKHAQ